MGGRSGHHHPLSSVEIFPAPSFDTCSVPDLPGTRTSHSLSLLAGGRLVVCGGLPTSKLCIAWRVGDTSWTHLHTTRSSYHNFYANKKLTFQRGKEWSCGLGSNISPQLHRAAWRCWRCSTAHSRDCARFWEVVTFQLFFVTGGGTFELRHSGWGACGVPDEDTIVMTGGRPDSHVTRWPPSSSPPSLSKNVGIKTALLHTIRFDRNKLYLMASSSPFSIETWSASILSQVRCQWLCRGTSQTARK